MSTVRSVAEVGRLAAQLGLRCTVEPSDVHGSWSGPGLVLAATEDASEHVRVIVDRRDAGGARISLTRWEPRRACLSDVAAVCRLAMSGAVAP